MLGRYDRFRLLPLSVVAMVCHQGLFCETELETLAINFTRIIVSRGYRDLIVIVTGNWELEQIHPKRQGVACTLCIQSLTLA
jgi:hypothetical protein